MEERFVTIDSKALALPTNFFVIATKNPFEEVVYNKIFISDDILDFIQEI